MEAGAGLETPFKDFGYAKGFQVSSKYKVRVLVS